MQSFFSVSLFVKQHRLLSILISVFLFTALFARLIANDLPLYASYMDSHCFPAFNPSGSIQINNERIFYKQIKWKQAEGFFIFPLVTYSPHTLDLPNADYTSPFDSQIWITDQGKAENLPFRFRHFLGTDNLGRDVLAGLIYGLQTSLFTAIFAMIMAALIALVTGGISGYYGDNGLKLSIGAIVISIISIPFIYFYTYELQRFNQQENIFLEISKRILILIVIGVAGWLLIRALKMISVFKRKVVFPIDSLITRITELITALPRLVLILALGALFKPSYLSLAIIIGLTSWNDMSRLLRAGILKAKQQPYIEAAHALGYSDLRILAIHALPNAIAPLITVFVFGISAAVIVESSLTFLGIGLPVESVSWGSILARGMENIRAWWLIVFPSLALFLTLLAMNRAGDIIQKMTNPRISIA